MAEQVTFECLIASVDLNFRVTRYPGGFCDRCTQADLSIQMAANFLEARFFCSASGLPTIHELGFAVTRAFMGADREHLEFPNMILTAHDFLEDTAVPRQNNSTATSFGAGF